MYEDFIEKVMSGYYQTHDQGEELLELDLEALVETEVQKVIEKIENEIQRIKNEC